MPTFSVVIPTYGRPEYLVHAIESVQHQTVDSYEIIVVDDASPVPVELPQSKRTRVVRADSNGGAARARNLGASVASGEVLTFLDDDDTWAPCRLQLAAEGLERAPVSVCWQGATGRNLNGVVHDTILDAITPNLGATAIERGRWRELDASYRTCEDIVWWLQVSRDLEVATVARQGLYVRQHPGERTGYGAQQRIADSCRLMTEFADYFAVHPRAAAFRYRRIGLMQKTLGNSKEARRAHIAAFRRQPNWRDVAHCVRNVR
jgi:glycosyltransferase involved in cell wall biosynthesis